MAAINAAWELHRRPVAASRLRPRAGDRGIAHATRSRATPPAARRRRIRAPGCPRPADAAAARDEVSRDWTSGRSSAGRRLRPIDADRRRRSARPARRPGNPSGSVLNFGRYAGWSLGEIARSDIEYIEWLDRMPIGRPYRDEIDAILRRPGGASRAEAQAAERRGLFRRR